MSKLFGAISICVHQTHVINTFVNQTYFFKYFFSILLKCLVRLTSSSETANFSIHFRKIVMITITGFQPGSSAEAS